MISVKSKIKAYLCVLAIVIPMTVQSGHIFDHEFQTCDHLDVSHIDTHKIDCFDYHAKILKHGFFQESELIFTESHEYLYRSAGFEFMFSNSSYQKLGTRGPPVE